MTSFSDHCMVNLVKKLFRLALIYWIKFGSLGLITRKKCKQIAKPQHELLQRIGFFYTHFIFNLKAVNQAVILINRHRCQFHNFHLWSSQLLLVQFNIDMGLGAVQWLYSMQILIGI